MRRLITFKSGLVALWMLLGLGVQAANGGTTTLGNITYTLSDDGTAKATSVDKSAISGEVVIPASLEFEGSSYNVTSISNNLFEGTKITSITIPNSVTTVGTETFKDCTDLTTVITGNGISVISENCFKGCTKLSSVTLSSNLKEIHNAGFSRCTSLTSIELPEGFTTINAWAFEECTALATITFPSSLADIAGAAFSGAKWYDNQPDGLVYAGPVLYKCKGTSTNTDIQIKEGTISVSNSAFNNCAGINSITVPNSVTKIGVDAFRGCGDLTTITIGTGVTKISARIFYTCPKLSSVTMHDNITVIEANAFFKCEALTSITLPKNLTTIETNAFSDCTALTAITIPAQVTSLGDLAFGKCNLNKVYCLNPVPPTFGDTKNPFTNTLYPTCYLMIPEEALNTYKEHAGWGKFEHIRGLSEDGKIMYIAAISQNKGGIISINDKEVTSENDTINIKEGSKVTFKIEAAQSFEIDKIMLNDKDITDQLKEQLYTIDTVDGDIKLDVTFKEQYSISDLKDNELEVVASDNKVIIKNKEYKEKVSVTDMAGQSIYEGTEAEVALNSGLYIVKVGNKISKVAIK